MLRRDFYDNNKHRVMKSMFPSELTDLYDTVVSAHAKYKRDLSVYEIKESYRVYNPTATRAKKEVISNLLSDIDRLPRMGEDLAQDMLTKLWQQEVGRKIADLGLSIMEGCPEKLQDIRSLIERTERSFVPDDDVDVIPTDLEELLQMEQDEDCWSFNIPSLSKYVRGGKGGEFMIAFARPEVGKTAFYVSLAASPNGFCSQGANVHIITNEEPARRTMIRAGTAFTGFTHEELFANRKEANKQFASIAQNLTMIDNVDASIEWLNVYCEKNKPDILIIDQLDKIGVSGTYARTDEKLRSTYTKFREICKRHGVFGIGISQASADAESKTNVTYAMMDNSKTGKAAEADLIIGIGKSDITDASDSRRYLTISKNKLTGFHGKIVCNLDTDRSRYTV